jgi:L-amino acid N-acyltransferase YncA
MIAIRSVQPGDSEAIAAIYAHHVTHGTGSFDFEAPDASEWRTKIAHICKKGWPFLVTHRGDTIMGYAYAAQIRDRPGYRYTCEDSIYVAHGQAGQGIGTILLSALIDASRTSGFRQMIAVIGGGEPASVALHAKLGFREVGRLHSVGFKFDRVLDSIYMQRALEIMP